VIKSIDGLYHMIATHELAQHIDEPDWALMDCRFTLTDPGRGRRDYLEAHIPGALYIHLNNDLAALPIPGKTGVIHYRH